MQSNQRSSKGKGRSRDADYAESFASLSLSECDPLTPRNDNYYDPSYTDAYGSSSYEQPYTGDDHYALSTQSSADPTQTSSSATYGSAGSYGSSYPASSYPTTSGASSTGGYEYQNELSGNSSYSGYTGYDTASVTSSSVPSYGGGGGSVSGWSDAHSYGTAASSAPSRHSNRTDVNNTINRQPPANERYQLPCEFHNLTNCPRVFTGDDMQGWMDHVEEHLRSKFPSKLRCWFCSDHYFDARETSGGDARSNFIMRMQHIRDHFVYDGSRPEQMLKDGHLVQHLLDHNLIDRRTYDNIVNPSSLPPLPGNQGSQSHHGHHRSHRSHRSHLPQVDEEVVAESSGSRHHHRSEHRRSDQHRSGHSGHSGHSGRRRDSNHGSSSHRHSSRNEY